MATQVTVSSRENLQQEVAAAAGTLLVDEPAELGGDGSGPNPYELLLAALGACTNMTLQIYARRKGWPLEAVETTLFHDRIHARDCEECEQREGYLEQIRKEIVLAGPLSDEQVSRLAEIAERCPVNRTLHASVRTTQLTRRAGEPG